MTILNVSLGARSYPIHIGHGLLETTNIELSGKRVAIVTNEIVAPLYLQRLQSALQKVGTGSTAIILPDGEAQKCWESLNTIYDRLLAERCDRTTPIIALGGG